jgi:hypothetical protein
LSSEATTKNDTFDYRIQTPNATYPTTVTFGCRTQDPDTGECTSSDTKTCKVNQTFLHPSAHTDKKTSETILHFGYDVALLQLAADCDFLESKSISHAELPYHNDTFGLVDANPVTIAGFGVTQGLKLVLPDIHCGPKNGNFEIFVTPQNCR